MKALTDKLIEHNSKVRKKLDTLLINEILMQVFTKKEFDKCCVILNDYIGTDHKQKEIRTHFEFLHTRIFLQKVSASRKKVQNLNENRIKQISEEGSKHYKDGIKAYKMLLEKSNELSPDLVTVLINHVGVE
jgi:hypothetical protein